MNLLKKPQNMRTRCQSTLEVTKITKRLNSRNPVQSKKHCPQDQACFHCCQCWVKFKDQYNKRVKFFQTKVSDNIEEIALLKRCIQKLTKENVDMRKKVKNTTDFETIKENLRDQLRKQINDEIKANDLIQKQKIASLTQELDQKSAIIDQMKKQISQLENDIKDLSNKLIVKESQCKDLELKLREQVQQRIKVQKKNSGLQEIVQKLNTQIQALRQALKQKDQNISQMKSTLDHTDRLISIKSTQLSQKDFQKTKLHLQCSYKSQVLQKLQNLNQKHSKSISQLQTDKSKLNQLVGSLKQQLMVTDEHKHILRMALGDAESMVVKKSLTLENLKHDVRMMKYTLPEALKVSKFFLED